MATMTGRRRIAGDRLRARRAGDRDDLSVEPVEPGEPVEPAEPGEPAEPAEPVGLGEVLTHETALEPAEGAEPAETGADPSAPTADVRRTRRPGVLTLVLAACLVALLVASGLAAISTRDKQADAAAGTAALAAARTSAATILSYDYRHLDADFAAATALTTGSLRTDYQATTSKAVAQLATQTHAVVGAKVVAGGVVSSTATTATVLLFVDQTTTSNRLSGPQVDQNRVQLTLHKVGDHWLVSALKAL